MKRALTFATLGTCVVAGCALVAGIEDTTTVDAPSDAGAVVDAPLGDRESPAEDEQSGPEVQPTAGDDDDVTGDGGGADAGAVGVACPGATPFVPSFSKAVSKVCNPSGGLAPGGDFAGLDCYGAGVETSKDGIGVTACIGFDFGSGKIDEATLRLYAIGTGCTYGCYADGCADKTATARFFVGTERGFGTWTKAGYSKVGTAPGKYKVVPPAGDFNVVAVCRGSAGAQYDDLAVDGVSAKCR